MRVPVSDQVRRLAALAQRSGLDGVVCSPHEAALLRADLGPSFKLVTPGVRPQWAAANDQKRVMTPAEALAQGADYVVIGRPITHADDQAAAARRIVGELAA
jgi:orotidine-5'-phosphate decarboxylase